MNTFLVGALATIGLLIGVPLLLAAAAGLLRYAFERGDDMVKIRPIVIRDAGRGRAGHASVLYLARSVTRLFWVSGYAVYLVKQNNNETWGGESRLGAVQHSIIEGDKRWQATVAQLENVGPEQH